MIGAVTTGLAISQARATSAGLLAQFRAQTLPIFPVAGEAFRCAFARLPRRGGLARFSAAPRRAIPPSSGLQGITPTPYARQAGSTSSSTVRSTRLYLLCSLTSPRKFRLAAPSRTRGDVPTGEIAAADVNNFALLHQQFHRLPDFIPRRFAVDVVHLVQIDVIGLHALEAVVAGPADFHALRPRFITISRIEIHVAVDFGGDHSVFAPPAALGEPAADDLFGDPLPRFQP